MKYILKIFGLLKPLRQWRASRELKAWSEHDEKMKSFYSQFLKDGQLCFDIGANKGNRTKIFLSLNANVVGIEPQPDCIEFLNQNFSSNTHFSLESVGLAEKEGEAEMNISEIDTLSSLSPEWIEKQNQSKRFEGIGWKGKIKINLKTFDQLIEKHGIPTFAKIDVEGYELNVLKGLNHKVDYLSFEFAAEFYEQLIECIDLLDSKFQSRFNFSSLETMALDFDSWMSAEEIKNYLSKYENNFKFFGDVYAKNL